MYCRPVPHKKLQEEFLRLGIPFHLVRGRTLMESAAVQDALAYLRLILNSRDDGAFERVYNRPKRRLGTRFEACKIS